MIDQSKPFFSHATKDIRYFARIIREGRLVCPHKLTEVSKFSSFADEYVGRTRYVMFSPGFGYIVDNANMQVSFLFSDVLLQDSGAIVHVRPVVYAVCEIIVKAVKEKQAEYWLEFFRRRSKSLNSFNHPLVNTTFSEYMLSFLSHHDHKLIHGDAWGPSTYSEGVIKVLYENNPSLKQELATTINSFNASNTLKSEKACSYFRCQWSTLNIYRHLQAFPLSDTEKSHTQLLVPDHVPVWRDGLLGLCVAQPALSELAHTLRKIIKHIPGCYRESLPVYCGRQVHVIDELLRTSSFAT